MPNLHLYVYQPHFSGQGADQMDAENPVEDQAEIRRMFIRWKEGVSKSEPLGSRSTLLPTKSQ